MRSLFFPEVCPVCDRVLVGGERHICLRCLSDLPYSYFWEWRYNPAEVMLNGKFDVERVVSLFIYREESHWKSLIHNFKYGKDKPLGCYLSAMLGKKIVEAGLFKSVDLIVPVPLHPFKRWKRGFNQAAVIAEELGRSLGGIEVNEKILKRRKNTTSQTIKDREEREVSVSKAFFLNRKEIEGREILLVDDVLTTGATVSACGKAILSVPGTVLNIATLAYVE